MRVAESPGEEKVFLPVTLKFSALAKSRHLRDVLREIVGGILTGGGLGGMRAGH